MRAFFLCALAGLCACGVSDVLPDGGRTIENCVPTYDTVPVTVLSAAGSPVSGASVSLGNVQTGQVTTLTTNGAGLAQANGSALGEGTFTVTAVANASHTPSGQIIWACDPCHCRADPANLTLQF